MLLLQLHILEQRQLHTKDNSKLQKVNVNVVLIFKY